ncbi:MAG: type IV-A pilus assembly ATPase PilB [Nitrospinota bacterium]|nr:type IV-A pilus assembly ATPase PilB [Nitrospinota bacterium]
MAQATEKKSSFKKSVQDSGTGEVLGKMLSKEGQITRSQLKEAEEIQKKTKERISKIIRRLGYMDEDSIIAFLSRQMSIPVTNITDDKPDPALMKFVPWELAKEYMVFPLRGDAKILRLAMLDPTNFNTIEAIGSRLKKTVKPSVVSEKNLADAYLKYYKIKKEEYDNIIRLAPADDGAAEEEDIKMVDDLGSLISDAAEDVSIEGGEEIDESDQVGGAADAAIVKLVNTILLKSVTDGASDIHIEPFEKSYQVRYRKDGVLHKSMNLPLNIKLALVSRIKIMAMMNIAEKRRPQDGRIKLRLGKGRAIDFRVSVLPTLFGESIVCRLLDQSKLQIDMTKLGFSKHMLEKFMELLKKPQGLILVTGPTGSGKTNTLYSAVNILNEPHVKILTAEDPVEFNFAGINQVNVRTEVGLTFASALKAFLRQDPEVILIGEIRDLDTAEIALKAASTGHMVFSTLHTNDCPSTVARILDIGIQGYMLSSALTGVLAQRLLRKICQDCKYEVKKIDRQMLVDEGVPKERVESFKVFQGKGCVVCGGSGFKGRVGAFELMEATTAVRDAITSQVPEGQLRKIAIKDGMMTLRMDAMEKVHNGVTTLSEALGKTVLVKEALPAYLLNPDELVFDDGDLIIKEGNTDRNFYQLLQGHLAIIKNGRIVGEISQPFEYFGEMSSLMDQPRTATIKSRGKSVVKVFPGDKLRQTIEDYPDIAMKIIRSLVIRLTEADKKISQMGQKQ